METTVFKGRNAPFHLFLLENYITMDLIGNYVFSSDEYEFEDEDEVDKVSSGQGPPVGICIISFIVVV